MHVEPAATDLGGLAGSQVLLAHRAGRDLHWQMHDVLTSQARHCPIESLEGSGLIGLSELLACGADAPAPVGAAAEALVLGAVGRPILGGWSAGFASRGLSGGGMLWHNASAQPEILPGERVFRQLYRQRSSTREKYQNLVVIRLP
jgi:hypothetical protein